MGYSDINRTEYHDVMTLIHHDVAVWWRSLLGWASTSPCFPSTDDGCGGLVAECAVSEWALEPMLSFLPKMEATVLLGNTINIWSFMLLIPALFHLIFK